MKIGANKGRPVDANTMVKDYWKLFGWDRETGHPAEETISCIASIA